jgi:hypothetical protein
MRAIVIIGVVASGLAGPLLHGQSATSAADFRNLTIGGIRLYGISAYSGYSTAVYPFGTTQLPTLGSGQLLGADVSYGASAILGWRRHRDKTEASILYTGSYSGFARYSGANAFNQAMSVNLVRQLRPRWTLTLSASGSDLTMAEYIYQPANVAVVSQSQATFDDLAAAFGLGSFSSAQSAAALASSPALESPARSLLMGNRVLSYAATAGFAYSRSSRLTFQFSSFTAGGQHRAGNDRSAADLAYVMPRTIGATAGVSMSYLLSPRTEFSLSAGGSRIDNRFQSAYSTSAHASIARKMSERWFVALHAGATENIIVAQAYGEPRRTQPTGSGSLGFRTRQQTLVGSYERAGSDGHGFAVGTNSTISSSWSWRRPGSRYSVFTSFMQQQVRNTGYASLAGWQASGGVASALSSQVHMVLQYAYVTNSGTWNGAASNLEMHAIRFSISWEPQTISH